MPKHGRGPYTAKIGGHQWAEETQSEFATIRSAREWAAEYGTQADWCSIYSRDGKLVASHRRDGSRWFRAEVS